MTPAPVTEIDYVEGAGPGIAELPESSHESPGTDSPGEGSGSLVAPLYPGWEQGTIEDFLKGGGAFTHLLIGAGEKDWKMTEEDLERIAPPLTRILNRWEPALKLSPYGDPILVAKGFAIYGWRSALEMTRAKRDAEEAAEGPDVVASYERVDDVEHQAAGVNSRPLVDVDELPEDYEPPPRRFE